MAKAILIIDVPNNCKHITAEVICDTHEGRHIHDLNYSMEGIIRRRRAYEVLKEHLDALKID